MITTTYFATIRSNTTFKTQDVRIDVHEGQTPEEVGTSTASSYGADLLSLTPENPLELLRNTLKESLGFIEAWQAHLSDTNSSKAAATVQDVLTRARDAYRLTQGLKG
jgi:hypothetical protein